MRLWQHDETRQLTWSDEQPSAKWHTAPTMYEDDLRADITDAQYQVWYADSAVVGGIRMGPRDYRFTKKHERIRAELLSAVTPEQSEWMIGYLPDGGAMLLTCDDCAGLWCGRRAVWSKAECDKSKLTETPTQ